MSLRSSGSFDPVAIITALDRHGVAYVLIGGAASVLHGAPVVTSDLDVVPERSDENITRLVACLEELGALRTTEPDEAPSSPTVDDLRYRIEQFDSPLGGIDVVFEANRIGGYERLRRNAETMEIEGVTVQIASLADLIIGKQWSDRDKDRVHLRLLLVVQKEREG